MAIQVKLTNLTNEGVEVDGYGINPPAGTTLTLDFSDTDYENIKPALETAAGMGEISVGIRFVPGSPPLITKEDGVIIVPATSAMNLSGGVDVDLSSDGYTADVFIPGVRATVLNSPSGADEVLKSLDANTASWQEEAIITEEYLVGLPGSGAPYSSIQAANDQRILDGHVTVNNSALVKVLPGRYVEDVSIRTPGIVVTAGYTGDPKGGITNNANFSTLVGTLTIDLSINPGTTISENTIRWEQVGLENQTGYCVEFSGSIAQKVIFVNVSADGNGILRMTNGGFGGSLSSPYSDDIEAPTASAWYSSVWWYGGWLRTVSGSTNPVLKHEAGQFIGTETALWRDDRSLTSIECSSTRACLLTDGSALGTVLMAGTNAFILTRSSITAFDAIAIDFQTGSLTLSDCSLSAYNVVNSIAGPSSGRLRFFNLRQLDTAPFTLGTAWDVPNADVQSLYNSVGAILNFSDSSAPYKEQDPSALVQLQSKERGFLPPVMSSFDRLNIATPARGLEVYDSDINYPFHFNGIQWSGDGYYSPLVPNNWAPPIPNSTSEALDDLAGIPFPNRVNISVNKSTIDNYQRVIPILRSQTGPNLTGAYNGGGIGNKPILGLRGFSGLPLGDIDSIEFTWKDLLPETTTLLLSSGPVVGDHGEPLGSSAIALLPFINLIVDLNGDGSLIKIFNMSQTLPPTSDTNFTVTALGPDKYNYLFDPLVNTFEIVLGLPPVPFVAPFINNGPSWFAQAFRMEDIIALGAYPNATLIDIASGDGGMPKDVVTPSIVLAMGGSSNVDAGLKIIEEIKFNGVRQ